MLEEPLDWRWYVAVGGGYLVATLLLDQVGVTSVAVRAALAGVMFASLGVLCLANWRSCGSLHCVVSGPPYLVLGGGALLVAFGTLTVPMDWIWGLFVVIIVVAFGLEWLLEEVREPQAA